jgi:hypothetical protein
MALGARYRVQVRVVAVASQRDDAQSQGESSSTSTVSFSPFGGAPKRSATKAEATDWRVHAFSTTDTSAFKACTSSNLHQSPERVNRVVAASPLHRRQVLVEARV